MRTRGQLVVVLLGLSLTGEVKAGLYFPAEPTPWPLPTNPRHFQDVLGERKNVAVKNEQAKAGPLRERVEELVKKLDPERRSLTLTVEESINLGACYILLQNPNDAIDVLE